MTEHRWQGSALLRAGVLAFIGSIGATDRHAHHAVQIITATTALTVVDGTGGLALRTLVNLRCISTTFENPPMMSRV
jgi:hypothetical protein